MRRGSALGLAAASCAALVGAWRIGAAKAPGTAAGGLAVPVPSASAPATTGASPTGRPTTGTKRVSPSASSTRASGPRAFDGVAEQTQYGTVQVRALVRSGRLVDVQPLHLTDSGGRSVQISADAAPILRREALAAGSARIDAVSGASYTSAGYIQSLQSALDRARAAGA